MAGIHCSGLSFFIIAIHLRVRPNKKKHTCLCIAHPRGERTQLEGAGASIVLSAEDEAAAVNCRLQQTRGPQLICKNCAAAPFRNTSTANTKRRGHWEAFPAAAAASAWAAKGISSSVRSEGLIQEAIGGNKGISTTWRKGRGKTPASSHRFVFLSSPHAAYACNNNCTSKLLLCMK